MTNTELETLTPGSELIWTATDDRGNHHDLKAVLVKHGKVQARIRTRDGAETWVRPMNLREAHVECSFPTKDSFDQMWCDTCHKWTDGE